jgi:hypothetical protein
MPDVQNVLFLKDVGPTNDAVFEQSWVRETTHAAGLNLVGVIPPTLRGHQWTLLLVPTETDLAEISRPEVTTTQLRVPLFIEH